MADIKTDDYTKNFPELKSVQKIELDILIELDKICRKNNLCYFLDSGTALGAVRHKGFIPWDDDIDVGMPRPDYNRFMRIAKDELGEAFFLQNLKTDPKVPFPYAKIRKNGTAFIEWNKRNIKMHHGIYIDIFPYDRLPEDGIDEYMGYCRELNRKLFKRRIPDRVGLPQSNLRWKIGKAARRLQYLAMQFSSEKKLLEKLNHDYTKYSGLGFDSGKSTCHSFSSRIAFPNEMLFPPIEVEFEGHSFFAPADVDAYLTAIYGDYMKLPPYKDRIGHRPFMISLEEKRCKR